MHRKSEFHVQIESAWALSNLTIHGSESQVAYTVQCGAIPVFCSFLHYRHQVIRCALQGLSNLLKKAWKDYGKIATMIKECGGLDEIKGIKAYESIVSKAPFNNATEICALSSEIIKQYFPSEVEN